MNNLIKLPLTTMDYPETLQVKFQLRQLSLHYGIQCLDNAVYGLTYGIVRIEECQRHVENLMLTYGTKLVMSQFEKMFQTKKVG